MRFLICDRDISYRIKFEQLLFECIDVPFMIVESKKAMREQSAINIDKRFVSQVLIIDSEFSNHMSHFIQILTLNNKGIKIIFTGTKLPKLHKDLEKYVAGFIQKPINHKIFENVINKIIEDYNRKNIRFSMPIRKSHSYEVFWVNDIRSIKTYYNDLEVVLCNGEVRECHVKSRYHIRNAVGCRWFLRVNENIMVNMNEIEFINDKCCIMKTGEIYKLSKVYNLALLKKYEIFKKLKKQGYYCLKKDYESNVLQTSYPRPKVML